MPWGAWAALVKPHYYEGKRGNKPFELELICSLGHITTLPKNANTKLLITEAAKQLTSVSRMVEIFRAEMLRLAQMMPEYEVVMGLYGVGETIGPQLMGEIGDVRDFASRKALVAFAGIDPGSGQSGQHNSDSESTSKRGSPLLRKCLFQAVGTYVKSVLLTSLSTSSTRKSVRNFVCTTAAANKFLRIYYARVKEHLDKTLPEEDHFPCQG